MQTCSYSGSDANHGPLSGIRVLDLSMLLPGPLCSMHLADLGAEVIKVEHPVAIDGTRRMGPVLQRNGQEVNAYFYVINRNKKAITLNYMRPEGKELLLRLLETADVLLEGFRPGMMDELGLGYTALKERFPRLIYCAISGYGATGPDRDKAGHDANYLAGTGILHITGTEEDPVLPGVQIADIAGGTLLALSGILAALYARERTGRGNFVDTGMMDGAFSMLTLHAGEYLATGHNPVRGKMQLSGLLPNYQIYRVRDGRHVVLAALEGKFFQVFLRQIGREDLLQRALQGEYEGVRAELAAYFATKTFDDLKPLFEHTDACLSPVLTIEEAFASPQLQNRNAIVELDDRRLGRIRVPGSPFHLKETPVSYRYAPPEPGEHNAEVYGALGLDAKMLEELKKKRIL
jgi:crotonobetainyl-CoA:carnitine CoA-transferase CaiB-like acyl-CoA transferase